MKHAWQGLIESRSGIVSLVGKDDDPRYADLPATVGGIVQHGKTGGLYNTEDYLGRGDARTMAKFTQYAIAATQQALHDSGWVPTPDTDRHRTGVCLGSGIGNLDDMYDTAVAFNTSGYRKLNPLFVPRLLLNMASGHISMKHGFQGPTHAVSTACTTGNHSIGDASRFIQFGDADVMVAGASEACVHPLAVAGFARAKALATNFNDQPEASSRPFDEARNGFVIGEGAGVVVLEELQHAKARGAQIYAELTGYGLSSDAHHMTAPPENGDGAARAMSNALAHAGLNPGKVDYINAHATSTLLGDVAEHRAIRRVMMAADINISSSKGAMGHLLGAAGAVESIFTILAIKNGVLPPTLNLENPSKEFDCNLVPKYAQKREIRHALSNSFG